MVVAATDGRGRRAALLVEDIREGNGGPLLCEELRLGGALTAGGAGDKGDFVLEPSGHLAPSLEETSVMVQAWWMIWLPGIALMVVAFTGNLMGDWLRDALDPRLRNLR